jgi:hypothetical protein
MAHSTTLVDLDCQDVGQKLLDQEYQVCLDTDWWEGVR